MTIRDRYDALVEALSNSTFGVWIKRNSFLQVRGKQSELHSFPKSKEDQSSVIEDIIKIDEEE